MSNITGQIPKLQKFTGEHQRFKISLGENQITNTHWGGRKSKPFSPGIDFVRLTFTRELSGVDSAGVLRQGVFSTEDLQWLLFKISSSSKSIQGCFSDLLYTTNL